MFAVCLCLVGSSQSFSGSSTAPIRIPQREVTGTLPVDPTNILQASAVQEVGTSEDGFTAQHSNNVSYSATQQYTQEVSTPEMPLQSTSMTFPVFLEEEIAQPHTAAGSVALAHSNPSQLQKVYTPVSLHDGSLSMKPSGKNQCASTSSSISELLRYNAVSNESILTSDVVYLPEEAPSVISGQTQPYPQKSVTPPIVVSTLPRANSYPRSRALKLNTSQQIISTQGALVTPPSTLRRHAHSMKQQSTLRSQSATQSSMTPPNALEKQSSVPTVLKRGSEEYEGNPLPQGPFFRPVSYASVNVASQHSICGPLEDDQQEVEYSPNNMSTMTLPSPKSHGPSHADGMHTM